MFPDQFYEERLSVREWNMKLLLETVVHNARQKTPPALLQQRLPSV